MRRMAIALALLAAACAPDGGRPVTSTPDPGVDPTWSRARVILPGQIAPVRMEIASFPASGSIPLVIYAHGCAGFGPESDATMRLLAENGFAVIAPDYFARSDARRVCPGGSSTAPAAWTGGYYAGYVERRLREAENALDRARALPWVDTQRVFMIGHSMGGATASQWRRSDVAGVGILGYDCLSNPQAHGLRVPTSVPVISISDRRDPWMAERVRGRNCGEFTLLRRDFTNVVLDNGDHSMIRHEQARVALVRWLRRS